MCPANSSMNRWSIPIVAHALMKPCRKKCHPRTSDQSVSDNARFRWLWASLGVSGSMGLVFLASDRGSPSCKRRRAIIAILMPGRRASLLAPPHDGGLAEEMRSARMILQPLAKDFLEDGRDGNPARRGFSLYALLLMDRHDLFSKVEVGNFRPNDLGTPGSRVGREADHRVKERLRRRCL